MLYSDFATRLAELKGKVSGVPDKHPPSRAYVGWSGSGYSIPQYNVPLVRDLDPSAKHGLVPVPDALIPHEFDFIAQVGDTSTIVDGAKQLMMYLLDVSSLDSISGGSTYIHRENGKVFIRFSLFISLDVIPENIEALMKEYGNYHSVRVVVARTPPF